MLTSNFRPVAGSPGQHLIHLERVSEPRDHRIDDLLLATSQAQRSQLESGGICDRKLAQKSNARAAWSLQTCYAQNLWSKPDLPCPSTPPRRACCAAP
jgi:hypothetical protein